MILRMTILTGLIALFGLSFSLLAQNAGQRAGSVFASESGDSCGYEQGIVCPVQIERITY